MNGRVRVVLCCPWILASSVWAADPWLMFRHDQRHTGLAAGRGAIARNGPPTRRWEISVAEPVGAAGLSDYRWYSGFPLGDLDGDGTLEVIVTTPDKEPGRSTGQVMAIRTAGPRFGQPMWPPFQGTGSGAWGCSDWFDQYSAALARCDGDSLPDIVFTAKGGTVRALGGLTGQVIWEEDTGRFIEAGPMVADLDGDGEDEVIVLCGAPVEPTCTPDGPAVLVFRAKPLAPPANPPRRVVTFPEKLDSGEPAIVDLNPPAGRNSKTLVFGSWSGSLHALWFDLAAGPIETAGARVESITMADVAVGTDGQVQPGESPVVRSSPLLWDFGQGETAVFAWQGDFTDIESSRISAVGLAFDPVQGTVVFTPRWTHRRVRINGQDVPVMDWKASVALLPRPAPLPPLVVSAGGRGMTGGGQTGNYGVCTHDAKGWVGAFEPDGTLAWGKTYDLEGNIRASCAVGDLDGDGRYEVVVPFGCEGMLRCYGDDGSDLWEVQLGLRPDTPWTQRSIGSPSIGDVDGDGTIEIVVSAFDGYVAAFGAPAPDTLVAAPGPQATAPPTVTYLTADGSAAGVAFSAYGATGYGANVASIELQGDVTTEVLTGPGPGAVYGPQVRAFARDGASIPGIDFYAYGTLRYGVHVAGGDVDGDLRGEILTGAGPGAVFGPHVRGFDYDGGPVRAIARLSFYAYGSLRWGVHVAAGEIDGTARSEIVTGPGPGAAFAAHLRGFRYDGTAVRAMPRVDALVMTPNQRYGLFVAAGSIDDDAYDELLVGAGPDPLYGSLFAGLDYDAASLTPLFQQAAAAGVAGGIGPSAGNLDADLADEIVTAATLPSAATVRGWDWDGGPSLQPRTSPQLSPYPTFGAHVAVGTLGW